MKTPDERKEFLRRLQLAASEADDMLGSCDASDILDSLEESRDYMFEAANLIEQLESQVPKWISVEERLPPNDDAVLIIVHNKSDAWTSVMIDVWDGGVWLDNADDDWHIVTHWMPLPEPPKEDS